MRYKAFDQPPYPVKIAGRVYVYAGITNLDNLGQEIKEDNCYWPWSRVVSKGYTIQDRKMVKLKDLSMNLKQIIAKENGEDLFGEIHLWMLESEGENKACPFCFSHKPERMFPHGNAREINYCCASCWKAGRTP